MNTNLYSRENNFTKELAKLRRSLHSIRFTSKIRKKKQETWNRLCRYALHPGIKIKAMVAATRLPVCLMLTNRAVAQIPARFLSVLLFVVMALFSNSVKAQNYALSFDGANDYVDCGSSSAFDATGIRTMECWVKFNDLSSTAEILSKSVSGQGIELLMYGNLLAFYAMSNGVNTSFMSYSTSGLTTGTWYHIAAAWDGTRESMRLYVNGSPVGTRSDAGNINVSGITNPAGSFRIGQWSDASSRPFNGSIEEVRVWNVQRTASEIKNGMYGDVAVNTAGLIAYYKMNEGSGTALNNATATPGLNGTLTNGPAWVSSPVQFGSNALNFDGVNDQVFIPANSAYDFVSGTIECFVRPGNLVSNAIFVGLRNSGGTRWTFHMSTADNTIGFWNNSAFMTLPFTITQGQWYHIAFVCNGVNTILYVNGTNIGTYNQAFSTVTGQTLVFGLAKNSPDGEQFTGDIDEVRIWNTVRTQAEVQAYKDLTLTGTETGLVGLFSFDQGINAGDNAGLTIAIDKSPTNNPGQVTNLAMNGGTSNWLVHSLITLPVSLSQFTVVKEGALARLQWQTEQEQNSREFIIERSADRNSFHAIGSVAAAGSSNNSRYYTFNDNSPQRGINYYRLKQVDNDARFAYSYVVWINSEQSAGISISPNPVKDVLYINTANAQIIKTMAGIYDVNGRLMQTILINNNQQLINVQPLATGVYTIKFADGTAQRFMKE